MPICALANFRNDYIKSVQIVCNNDSITYRKFAFQKKTDHIKGVKMKSVEGNSQFSMM